MSNFVTFPCEYLVIHSGYEYNLTTKEHIENFKALCNNLNVIPLYYYEIKYDNPLHPTQGIILRINNSLTADDVSVADRLLANQISDCIVIKTDTFDKASKVFLEMESLDYYAMGNIKEIKFLTNKQGIIDIVYVTVDAEAGLVVVTNIFLSKTID